MRERPLAYAACVFLAGLTYQRYEIKALLVVMLLLLLWELYLGVKHKGFVKAAGRSILLLSAFLLGISHMQSEEDFRQAYMSKIVDGKEVTVWGELIKTEITDWGIRGVLSDCYIRLEEEILPCNDIMVYFSSNPFQMGQIHKVTGKINTFSEARNQGNFDLQGYYHSILVDFSIYAEKCVILSEGLSGGKKWLLNFREDISAVYSKTMSQKAAGFYQGMVLGDKTNLDETIKDLFNLGGISHILAISGLHVSIIGRSVYQRLRNWGLGFLPSGIFGGCLLVAYCIMVGNGMSTVRAVGMMLIYFLAQYMGRSYDMLNGLGAMVLALLWENPFLIEYSGFWFSVMALVGIGIVGKELSACVKKSAESAGNKHTKSDVRKEIGNHMNDMKEKLWMNLGITLTTLPVSACCYYEIPMYSPLVNFVALPVLTPIFCLAIIGGIVGIGFPELAGLLLKPCEWLLFFYEWLCDTVSKLPWASVICGEPSAFVVVVYYVILFAGTIWLIFLRKRVVLQQDLERDKKRKEILQQAGQKHRTRWAVAMSIVCFVLMCYPKAKPFEITFLDVGQGDGIYMSAGDGTTYFIDGGSTSVEGVGEYRILPFLKSKGIASIDYWFVSHCDRDHVSGIWDVLESGYEIKHLVVAKHCPKDEMYEKLLTMAQEAEVEVLYMDKGHRVSTKNIEITCLAPGIETFEDVNADRNENSLVLQVKWTGNFQGQSFKALFAGDISTEIEDSLCKRGLLGDVDLFKAIHHGSNYSNGDLLLKTVKPEYIVVSCSERNLYGHPGKHAVERMKEAESEIFYTMYEGQVTIQIDKKGLVNVGGFLIQ